MRTSTFTRAARKLLAATLAAALALGLMPALGAAVGGGHSTASAAEQDESAQQLPIGSISNDAQEEASEASAEVAPEASAQSADAKAASGSGSAGGTTVSIQVYRSSFLIVKWDLNDDDFNLTKAAWAGKPADADLPQRGTPGQAIEWTAPSGYAEPTRAGFEFAGWSTDKSASAGGFLSAEPRLTMPEGAPDGGEYTLYALWTPLEYSVIFDLAKNPDVGAGPGSDASFDLKWDSKDGVRTVTDLGNGRYRVDGFTMKESDYDATTRTVGLPVPNRTGYRFLGWAEPDGQALAIDNAAKDGYAMNPVRLTQIDGTPVLTARWASAFGVTAPLSITFGDYDKTGAPGNPSLGSSSSSAASDTGQTQQDKDGVAGQAGYATGGQAYFQNTSWNDPIRMVELTSTRNADANKVLTTFDSSKAEEADVLGGAGQDGVEREGERLLSIYPSSTVPTTADERKAQGVHLRLADSAAEPDLGAFAMGAAGSDTDRIDVSYGLNLSTDPVSGAANHGLVLETNDYDRMPIAQLKYTFAIGEAADHDPYAVAPGGDKGALYVEITSAFLEANGLANTVMPGTYGLSAIKAAANDLASKVTAQPPATGATQDQLDAYWDAVRQQASTSRYYGLYKALLDAQTMTSGTPGSGPYFKVKVDGAYLDLQLIGICQDTKTSGGKAGLTFQMRDIFSYGSKASTAAGGYGFSSYMNTTDVNAGGWESSGMRSNLHNYFIRRLDSALQGSIVGVDKFQQSYIGITFDDSTSYLQQTTDEKVWLPSMYEVYGTSFLYSNDSEALANVPGYVPFHYMAYQGNDGSVANVRVAKAYNGVASSWWLRSARRNHSSLFCTVDEGGGRNGEFASNTLGAVPCFCL